jgi:hypothetical protein
MARARIARIDIPRPFSDRIEIFLSPQAIELKRLLRSGTTLSRRYRCLPADSDDAWRIAVGTMVHALEELGWRDVRAKLILSNHFVRYSLLPGGGSLRNDLERTTAGRHHLRTTYGDRAESWRIAPGFSGGTCVLTAAVDYGVIEEIIAVLRKLKLHIQSIEPLLTSQFNRCRRYIDAAPTWLATIEPGRLGVAYFENQTWRSMHSERIPDDNGFNLIVALDRYRLATGGLPGRILSIQLGQLEDEPISESAPNPVGSEWPLEQAEWPNAPSTP